MVVPVPPPSHHRSRHRHHPPGPATAITHRSPTSHHRTPCPTGTAGPLRHMALPHAYTALLPTGDPPVASRTWQWLYHDANTASRGRARRSPISHASPACPTSYGRRARTSPQTRGRTQRYISLAACRPCRLYISLAAGHLCPWLYRNATTLSRRWDRRPPPARGCTAMPPHFLVGGPAGRLMHVAVPQCHHSL